MGCSAASRGTQNNYQQAYAPWNLNFYYFYRGKQTHTKVFEFASRRDCFEAMYQMQVTASKRPFHSGAGICTKWFNENQVRTDNDLLGYR
jgi:hypothetical protein